MRIDDTSLFTSIANHLTLRLALCAPSCITRARPVRMDGAIHFGLSVRTEGIQEPSFCVVRRDGFFEIGEESPKNDGRFVKKVAFGHEAEYRRLVRRLAYDAMDGRVNRMHSWVQARTADHGPVVSGADEDDGFTVAIHIAERVIPNFKFTIGRQTGARSFQTGDFVASERDGVWYCGTHETRDTKSAVTHIALLAGSAAIAELYVSPECPSPISAHSSLLVVAG